LDKKSAPSSTKEALFNCSVFLLKAGRWFRNSAARAAQWHTAAHIPREARESGCQIHDKITGSAAGGFPFAGGARSVLADSAVEEQAMPVTGCGIADQ